MAARPMIQEFTRGISEFSLDLYKLFTSGNENIFMSPYSVAACLLLVDLGASGETEVQIREVLGVQRIEKETVHRLYQQLQASLNAETKGTTTLTIANRMYAKLGLQVKESYIKDSKQFYGSELQQLNFGGDSETSRQVINKWVEEQTKDKIKDLIPSECINDRTLLILVNAIYFKGSWEKPFRVDYTSKAKFTVSKDDVRMIDMMEDKRDCGYLKHNKLMCSALSLPYQSKNLSMVFFLPKDVNGLSKLEGSLTSGELTTLCRDVVQSRKQEVILGIPKFKMEATYEMEKELPRLGINDMFESNSADFSMMFPSDPDACVTDVIHKAFVEVNEEGTEAAAATAMGFSFGCTGTEPQKFILDHPFLFVIWDQGSSTILFMGRYVKPPSNC